MVVHVFDQGVLFRLFEMVKERADDGDMLTANRTSGELPAGHDRFEYVLKVWLQGFEIKVRPVHHAVFS